MMKIKVVGPEGTKEFSYPFFESLLSGVLALTRAQFSKFLADRRRREIAITFDDKQ